MRTGSLRGRRRGVLVRHTRVGRFGTERDAGGRAEGHRDPLRRCETSEWRRQETVGAGDGQRGPAAERRRPLRLQVPPSAGQDGPALRGAGARLGPDPRQTSHAGAGQRAPVP